MSRFLAAASLTAVALLVALGAGPSLGADVASPRAASSSAVPAAPEGRLDPHVRGVASRARPPAPIAGRGYRVVFEDPFKRLRRRVWDNREWYSPPPPARSQYVRRGVLHLVSRRSQGYRNIAVTTFSSRKLFRFGYFEARMKWTRGNGSWPGFWLLSYRHATNPNWPQPACPEPTCLSAEIDVFEGYGNHPRVFTGTIHRNSCECYGEPNEINANNWQPRRVNLTRRFHTYAMRWTPARVTWFLDQRRVMSWPVFETTNTRMFLLFTMYIGGQSSPDGSTPNELHTKVNWVRVWQKR